MPKRSLLLMYQSDSSTVQPHSVSQTAPQSNHTACPRSETCCLMQNFRVKVHAAHWRHLLAPLGQRHETLEVRAGDGQL